MGRKPMGRKQVGRGVVMLWLAERRQAERKPMRSCLAG